MNFIGCLHIKIQQWWQIDPKRQCHKIRLFFRLSKNSEEGSKSKLILNHLLLRLNTFWFGRARWKQYNNVLNLLPALLLRSLSLQSFAIKIAIVSHENQKQLPGATLEPNTSCLEGNGGSRSICCTAELMLCTNGQLLSASWEVLADSRVNSGKSSRTTLNPGAFCVVGSFLNDLFEIATQNTNHYSVKLVHHKQ